MLSANKLEKYKRIRYFFPEQINFLRRYNKDFVRDLRVKKGWFWTKTSFDEAKKRSEEAF
jgi:hypothetical protein